MNPLANHAFPIYHEQFDCPQCESMIPLHLVYSRYQSSSDNIVTRRVITATCAHCNKSFRRTFELRCGIWSPIDSVEEITDRKTLAGVRRRADKLENTQLAQSA